MDTGEDGPSVDETGHSRNLRGLRSREVGVSEGARRRAKRTPITIYDPSPEGPRHFPGRHHGRVKIPHLRGSHAPGTRLNLPRSSTGVLDQTPTPGLWGSSGHLHRDALKNLLSLLRNPKRSRNMDSTCSTVTSTTALSALLSSASRRPTDPPTVRSHWTLDTETHWPGTYLPPDVSALTPTRSPLSTPAATKSSSHICNENCLLVVVVILPRLVPLGLRLRPDGSVILSGPRNVDTARGGKLIRAHHSEAR